jgi:hypothetical protein
VRLRRSIVAVLDDLSVTGIAQRSLRVVLLLAALLAWQAGDLAGAGDSPVVFSVMLVGAAWCAIDPDSLAGLVVVLSVGWQWLVHLDRTTSGWLLLAACCLLVFHAAASVAASTPAAASLDRTLLRPAALRVAALAAVTTLVWLAVRVSPLTGRPGRVEWLVAGAALLTVVALGARRALRATGRS